MRSRQTFCSASSRLSGAAAAGLLTLFSAQAFAQVLPPAATPAKPAGGTTLEFIGKENGSWSSNPLMAFNGATPLWGSITSPELIFKSITPTSQLGLDTTVDENVFNQKAYNSTDVHEKGNLTFKNSRWSTGILQSVDYDTTRTSELSNYNFGPTVARRLGWSATPQISFIPTPTSMFTLAGTVSRSQYDNDLFTNFETFSITPSFSHQFDPNNTGYIVVQGQEYDTTRNNAERIDSIGPSIGWQTVFSPRLSVNASFGAQASRQYNFGVPIDTWNWQYVFSGGLTFKGQQDDFTASTMRSQFPYGNGTQALQTSFGLTEAHNINSLFTLNFSANYLMSQYQNTGSGNIGSMSTGLFGFSWHMTPELDLTTSYQYRYETLTHESEIVQDHAVKAGLTYHPNMWTIWR